MHVNFKLQNYTWFVHQKRTKTCRVQVVRLLSRRVIKKLRETLSQQRGRLHGERREEHGDRPEIDFEGMPGALNIEDVLKLDAIEHGNRPLLEELEEHNARNAEASTETETEAESEPPRATRKRRSVFDWFKKVSRTKNPACTISITFYPLNTNSLERMLERREDVVRDMYPSIDL